MFEHKGRVCGILPCKSAPQASCGPHGLVRRDYALTSGACILASGVEGCGLSIGRVSGYFEMVSWLMIVELRSDAALSIISARIPSRDGKALWRKYLQVDG